LCRADEIIASKATLIGHGEINGFVVNYGAIKCDHPGGSLSFTDVVTNYGPIGSANGGRIQFLKSLVNYGIISSISPPSITVLDLDPRFGFSFPSQNGLEYFVEFKN